MTVRQKEKTRKLKREENGIRKEKDTRDRTMTLTMGSVRHGEFKKIYGPGKMKGNVVLGKFESRNLKKKRDSFNNFIDCEFYQ